MTVELKRANKVTGRCAADDIMVISMYKTNVKLGEITSDDPLLTELGFSFPVDVPAVKAVEADVENGIEAVEAVAGTIYTANEKLELLKNFVQMNAAKFGYSYDPVDRRSADNTYPSSYQDESLVKSTAVRVTDQKLTSFDKTFATKVESAIKKGLLAEDSNIEYIIDEDNVVVSIPEEDGRYKNGNIKYATVVVPFSIGIESLGMVELEIEVQIKSGQISKPKKLGDDAFTATELIKIMTEANAFPKTPEKVKEENTDEAAVDEDVVVDEETVDEE